MINMRKITGISLAGMIAVTSLIPAFAADQTRNNNSLRVGFEQLDEKYKSVLDGLVTDGIITQDQADAILKAVPEREGKGGTGGRERMGFEKLVEEGTITQEQADAIQEAMKAGIESKKSMDEIKAGLVEAGTITQDQADAIFKVPEEKNERGGQGRRGGMGFEKLVEEGTITQDQADAIQEVMKAGMESKKSMDEIKSGLVEAGTITQEQADEVFKAPEGKGGQDRLERPGGTPIGGFNKLIEEGTITQDQADAIFNALKSAAGSNDKSN